MRRQVVAAYIQAILYIAAGLNHFRKPEAYAAIIPSFLPHPTAIVYVSGIAEITLGILLLVPFTRRLAGIGIIILLIIIFPANIKMAIDYVDGHRAYAWAALVRLPLQFVLIWLAWWSTQITRSSPVRV